MKPVAPVMAIFLVVALALIACGKFISSPVESSNPTVTWTAPTTVVTVVVTVPVTLEPTEASPTQPTATFLTPAASPTQPVISSATPVSPPVVVSPALDALALQDTLIQLYEGVNPGIVAIRVLTLDGQSLGSGFVIDKDGHVITNYHVVKGYADVEVTFPSGFMARGKVIGEDPDSDLAVVKVEAPPEELHPLTLGDSGPGAGRSDGSSNWQSFWIGRDDDDRGRIRVRANPAFSACYDGWRSVYSWGCDPDGRSH